MGSPVIAEAVGALLALAALGCVAVFFALFLVLVIYAIAHNQRIVNDLRREGATLGLATTSLGAAGDLDGVHLELLLDTRNPVPGLRGIVIDATIPADVPAGLTVDGRGCALLYPFGPPEHPSGDPGFDRVVTSRGPDAVQVLALVKAPPVKADLLELDRRFAGKFRLSSHLRCFTASNHFQAGELAATAREVSAVARTIAEHLAPPAHRRARGPT